MGMEVFGMSHHIGQCWVKFQTENTFAYYFTGKYVSKADNNLRGSKLPSKKARA
jgi:hypothetical protein